MDHIIRFLHLVCIRKAFTHVLDLYLLFKRIRSQTQRKVETAGLGKSCPRQWRQLAEFYIKLNKSKQQNTCRNRMHGKTFKDLQFPLWARAEYQSPYCVQECLLPQYVWESSAQEAETSQVGKI
jgi:hypothetical protein